MWFPWPQALLLTDRDQDTSAAAVEDLAWSGGPRVALEALVARHDLAGTVKILGQRPQSEVGMLMRDAEALVFEAIGSRVPLGTKAELVTAFRRELEALAAQPDPIRDLSKAAHERAVR